MKIKQVEAGKAFEYAIATTLSRILGCEITQNTASEIARAAYNKHDDEQKGHFDIAAGEAATFLESFDCGFSSRQSIYLQADSTGKLGDVRDIVIVTSMGEIGISAKNNHRALKHSRLSDKIDFGKEWADYPCSSRYFQRIKPAFDDMRAKRGQGVLFRDIPNKADVYYLPILTAFEDELRRLFQDFGVLFVKRMFQYLLGKHDFYKVIKDDQHHKVSIQSVNINGALRWGTKWKIPDKIERIARKDGSINTLLVSFVGGWQLSFRLHNASSKVEPSLKFDINFVGLPENVARQDIPITNV